MSAMQTRKGKQGERELARLLSDHLGTAVKRNLGQSRDGGFDLLIPGWSLEVKRAAMPRVSEWWEQTLMQAEKSKLRPVLAYRQDFKPWHFVIRLADLVTTLAGQPDGVTAELCIDGFCMVVRESLPVTYEKVSA